MKEEDCQCVETKTQALGCLFSLYVSFQKKLGGWGIGRTHLHHNHPTNPYPFQYIQHVSKRPGYLEALDIAAPHRGIISYKLSSEILRKDSSKEIDWKKFYNLNCKAGQGSKLDYYNTLDLILETLEKEGVHPRFRNEYLIVNRKRDRWIIKDIFWQSPEQIWMTQRL